MWNPEQYLKFEHEREKPFYDLLKMVIPKENMHILDLGCGTGALTYKLHESLKAESTLGIDLSQEMLKKAPTHILNLNFQREDISSFSFNNRYDLIFSNAALHWVSRHDQLFPRLFKALKDDGQIAIQVPDVFAFATHTMAQEVASATPFKEALSKADYPAVMTIEDYAAFFDQYRQKMVTHFGEGPLFIPFKRILMWGRL